MVVVGLKCFLGSTSQNCCEANSWRRLVNETLEPERISVNKVFKILSNNFLLFQKSSLREFSVLACVHPSGRPSPP
jgi:hypothetical protein